MAHASELSKRPTLRLRCPKCQGTGLIPWDKLDRTVICGGCQTWYRIDNTTLRELPQPREDRYRVQVRTSSSAWEEHRAVVSRPKTLALRAHEAVSDFVSHGKARWFVAAGLAAAIVAWALLRPVDLSNAPRDVEVPADLQARAACLLEALARRDTTRIFMLTDTNFHRALRIWLANGKDLPAAVSNDASLETKVLGVAYKSEKRQGERVEFANVRSLLLLPSGKTTALDQRWVNLASGWQFQPPVLRNQGPPAKRIVPNDRANLH